MVTWARIKLIYNLTLKERYAIIRSYGYGKDFNVYKAHKRDELRAHYVIKRYETRESFERESQMLKRLNETKVVW